MALICSYVLRPRERFVDKCAWLSANRARQNKTFELRSDFIGTPMAVRASGDFGHYAPLSCSEFASASAPARPPIEAMAVNEWPENTSACGCHRLNSSDPEAFTEPVTDMPNVIPMLLYRRFCILPNQARRRQVLQRSQHSPTGVVTVLTARWPCQRQNIRHRPAAQGPPLKISHCAA